MKTNQQLQQLIVQLQTKSSQENVGLWRKVASDLEKSSRRKSIVNLLNLQKNTQENDIVVVPGKVLGDGEVSHKLTVAAFMISKSAEEKLQKAGSKLITIQELMAMNLKGKNVRVLA